MVTEGRDLHARFESGAGRRLARLSAASGNPGSRAARPDAAARRRQGAPGLHRDRARSNSTARVEVGGKLSDRKGVSLPETVLPFSALRRQGPLRSRCRARYRHRLDGLVVRPAARRHRRSQEDHARPRRGDGQDREAAGGDAARRDHGSCRRADGGARRSRRRNAAREGAGHPEADHARGAPRRQAGGGRDPDAGIDDHKPGADARRSLRRRHRRSSKAPTPSCCRRNPPPANIRSRRSRP